MTDQWVQHTADDYAAATENLLPTGNAWPRDPDSNLMAWVQGSAQLWGDVSSTAALLAKVESDPRFTVLMLSEWEANFGLPDPCVKAPDQLSLADRRAALVQKITTQGGASRAFFIALAKSIGYNINIVEYSPFQYGVSSYCGPRGAYYYPGSRFYWQVTVSAPRFTRFQYGYSQYGNNSYLNIMRADDLECVMNRWKPAHTTLIFNYVNLKNTMLFFFPY